MIKGVDISKWQGVVDFSKVKTVLEFVIIKATEGVGYTDTKFLANQKGVRDAKILLGYYHFARPDLNNTPEAEADYFLKIIGQLKTGELLVLDYECANQVQAHVTWCKKWLDRIFAKTGVRPLIYLNQSQTRKFNWLEVVNANYGLWLASYTHDANNNTGETGQWKTMAMQQYTNKLAVPGISGNVDGNVFFGTLASLKKYGYNPVVVPSSSVSPSTSKSVSPSASASPSEDPCSAEVKALEKELKEAIEAKNAIINDFSDYKTLMAKELATATDKLNVANNSNADLKKANKNLTNEIDLLNAENDRLGTKILAGLKGYSKSELFFAYFGKYPKEA